MGELERQWEIRSGTQVHTSFCEAVREPGFHSRAIANVRVVWWELVSDLHV